MTTKVLDFIDTQKVVINGRHLDNAPQDRIDYSHPDTVSTWSYHDSDSDRPDYELHSVTSFHGVDLDASDADSWGWTFRDEIVSDLEIKLVPEPAKAVMLLRKAAGHISRENVEVDESVLSSQEHQSLGKRSETSEMNQENGGRITEFECSRDYSCQGKSDLKTCGKESRPTSQQRNQNGKSVALTPDRKQGHSSPALCGTTSGKSHIQSSVGHKALDDGDNVVYFENGGSSKVFKMRLKYLSYNSSVGRNHRRDETNKRGNHTNTKKKTHCVNFLTRPLETRQMEKRNTTRKLPKLEDTESRFMKSGHNTNNVHVKTRSHQDRTQSLPSTSHPRSDYVLPPIRNKRIRPVLAKACSLNDLVERKIVSWRLNRSRVISRPDVLVGRPSQAKAAEISEGHGGSLFRQSRITSATTGLGKFRHLVRLVILLLQAVPRRRSQKGQESNHKFLSWTVLYDEVLGVSRLNYDRGALTFDPQAFKANRESTLSPEIKDVLRLSPESRTEAQIHAAMVGLHSVIPSFSEFPKGIQQSMIQVCTYERFEPGRVIIRQGHRAENFYFIIGGSAVVTQMDSEAGHAHTTNVLGKGHSFGELAFLHMSKRSATVTCREHMEVLCIEREDFIDIFMRPHKGDEPDHIAFLKSVDLLQGWPVSLLPHVNPKICAFTYVRRDVILCLDGASSDWIFVVYSGSCKVLKALIDGPSTGREGKIPPGDPQEGTSATKPGVSPKGNNASRSVDGKTTANIGGQPQRHRRDGIWHPGKDTTLADRNGANRLPSQIDHFSKINDIVDRKHILPTILGDRQTGQDKSPDTSKRKVSREKPLRQKVNPGGKPKQQFPGPQPASVPPVGAARDETAASSSQGQELRKTVFVEIARLETGEIFGLEHVVLLGIRNVASCSLVSEGAEVVLISKSFFKKHLTEDTVKRMRQLIRPLPSEKSLQKRLESHKLWEFYKSRTLTRQRLGQRIQGVSTSID